MKNYSLRNKEEAKRGGKKQIGGEGESLWLVAGDRGQTGRPFASRWLANERPIIIEWSTDITIPREEKQELESIVSVMRWENTVKCGTRTRGFTCVLGILWILCAGYPPLLPLEDTDTRDYYWYQYILSQTISTNGYPIQKFSLKGRGFSIAGNETAVCQLLHYGILPSPFFHLAMKGSLSRG